MIFKQIKSVGDNFSYLIADEASGKAIVVDPAYNGDRIIREAQQSNLKIDYIINTHYHTDHVADNEKIKSLFNSKIMAYKGSKVKTDKQIGDGDLICLRNIQIQVIHTPGHTPDSICLLVNGNLLTGDTLFVGECGRTDFIGGSSEELYHSLFQKVLTLNDAIKVYPGHDYGPTSYSTIGKERKTNYTLKKRTLEEFIQFMKEP